MHNSLQRYEIHISLLKKKKKRSEKLKKIRRGPKLEGYTFAYFGNSSETEGKSRPCKEKCGKNYSQVKKGSLWVTHLVDHTIQ